MKTDATSVRAALAALEQQPRLTEADRGRLAAWTTYADRFGLAAQDVQRVDALLARPDPPMKRRKANTTTGPTATLCPHCGRRPDDDLDLLR